MNAPQSYQAGVSHQIGRYSDAIRVPAGYDQIVVSGTPVATAMVWPEIHVEVEAVALVPSGR